MNQIKELYAVLNNSKFDAFQYKFNQKSDLSYTSFEEGIIWMRLGFELEKNNYYNTQAYVALCYASEMFLKSIIIKKEITIKRTHKLLDLFKLIDKKDKKQVIDNIKINAIKIMDKDNKVIKELKSFDDYLEYVSNFFVDLRYDFQKIPLDKTTIVPTKFINDFTFALFSLFDSNIN